MLILYIFPTGNFSCYTASPESHVETNTLVATITCTLPLTKLQKGITPMTQVNFHSVWQVREGYKKKTFYMEFSIMVGGGRVNAFSISFWEEQIIIMHKCSGFFLYFKNWVGKSVIFSLAPSCQKFLSDKFLSLAWPLPPVGKISQVIPCD